MYNPLLPKSSFALRPDNATHSLGNDVNSLHMQ
jgi:hypothetical protein